MKHIKLFLLLFTAFLLLCTTVNSQEEDWLKIFQADNGNEYYINTKETFVVDDIASIWVKLFYGKNHNYNVKGVKVNTALINYKINLLNRTYCTSKAIDYDSNHNILGTEAFECNYNEFVSIPPSTAIYTIYKYTLEMEKIYQETMQKYNY